MLGFKSFKRNSRYASDHKRRSNNIFGNQVHSFNDQKNFNENGINKKEHMNNILDYLSNISYIVNDKYEKYFVYEVKEDKLKKGNHAFNYLNLEFVYNLEEDISVIEQIKNEINGYEIELLNLGKFSKILEKVIIYCFFLLKYNEKNVNNTDISIQCLKIYNKFFKIVKSNIVELSQSKFASHVVQSVISVFPFFAKYEKTYIEQIKKDDKEYEEIIKGFTNICDEIIENLFVLIFNKCGTHVLRSVFYSLSGYLHINISYRKSKISKKAQRNHLNYTEVNYNTDEQLFPYIFQIIDKLTKECEHPTISLEYKDILYQYVFCDSMKKEDKTEKIEKLKINKKKKMGKDDVDDTIINDLSNDMLMESESQHFICPLLYNMYSIGALTVLFEIIKEKNVECKDLCSKIFLIEKTKKYNFHKIRGEVSCDKYTSPLNQLLDVLMNSRDASILIERIFKIKKNEHIFYVFTEYILKNLNKLLLENVFSYTVLCNYFSFEFITEEMFDLIIKEINLEEIIKSKKFTILKCMFNLSKYYQIHCKHLASRLIKSFNLCNKNNSKYMWICIITMHSYDDLPCCLTNVLNKSEDNLGEKKEKKSNEGGEYVLNNYTFNKYFIVNTIGCEILSCMLSFPRESIVPLLSTFSYFCRFLNTVYKNKASQEEIDNYQNYCDFYISKFENRQRHNDHVHKEIAENYNDDSKKSQYKNGDLDYVDANTDHVPFESTASNIVLENDNKEVRTNDFNEHLNNVNESEEEELNTKKYNARQKLEMRKNILLFFTCDKKLSILCENICHTFNILDEKLLHKFILIFKEVYAESAAHYIGCHVIVTFFKLGTYELKKSILDELIKVDIKRYNSHIHTFMKLKEYIQTKTVDTSSKYTKVKKLFEDILMPKEEKIVKNDGDIMLKTDKEESGKRTDEKEKGEKEKIEKENVIMVKDVSKREHSHDHEERKKKKKSKNNKRKEKKKEKKMKKDKKKSKKKTSEEKKENITPIKNKKENIETSVTMNFMYGSNSVLKKDEDVTNPEKELLKNDTLVSVISGFIENTKKKSRKRKKEKETIEKVLKKKI